ncbi:DNA repair protein XRCC2 homolog isoform X1 [Hordeum vulgare subsp. vulgare]|uniref:RecA family profile 1 domain-containing protein n=1 Tax=Hordeum vulgare subsp. vulgare TaxID=112509 RepID=A0A8I6XB72_HORVV|nr:DNA repair protein XRCC2 homolog isoform X1 [Hordeum vulgare subsp. vulgare]
MVGEAEGVRPRDWLSVDETAAAFLSRSLSTRPPILLPPPLHRAPLRPGNVVEIAGPSGSGKSQLLLMSAVQCILPKEWEGVHFGGLGKAVMYIDLDCRFDVLRLAQILRKRIAAGCGSVHPTNEEFEIDGSKDEFHSLESTLFSDCMKRFLYVRCYNSSELIDALKSLKFQSEARSEVFGISVYFLMLDSIGAFYWIDRALQPTRESKGKALSFQSITETVIQEIHKFLQLQPILVLVTKAPIYGEGITTSNDFQRGSSKYMSEDSTALRYPKREEERNGSCREYMPSAWQTFVTHRIKLQDLAQEAVFFSEQENEMLSVHTCEWVQPFLNSKEKFYIKDDGVGLIH